MTREEASIIIGNIPINSDTMDDCYSIAEYQEAKAMSIESLLEQESNIKALGEDMRICQKAITDEKVLIGFNMAVAICNKHLAESEEE